MISLLVSIALAAGWWLLYRMVFRRYSFFRLNRWLLLAGMAVSAGLPFLPVPVISTQLPVTTVHLPDILVNNGLPGTGSGTGFNWWLFFWLGSALFALRQPINLFRAFRQARAIRRAYVTEGPVSWLPPGSQALSFGPWAFIPRLSDPADEELILRHEMVHIRQMHFLDRWICELLCAFLWWNLPLRGLVRELYMVHEWEADALTHGGNIQHYGRLLLREVVQTPSLKLSIPFFPKTNNLKSRITMMTKPRSSSRSRFVYLLVLPLLAGSLFLAVACNKSDGAGSTPETIEIAKADRAPVFTSCGEVNDSASFRCFFNGVSDHIRKNFKYPEDALQAGVQGRVYIRFVVDETGKVSLTEIVRSERQGATEDATETEVTDEVKKAWDALESQAMSLVGALEKVEPAQVNGKPVAITFVVPITFKLS